MKRGHLTWWEETTIAFSVWLAFLLGSLRPRQGVPPELRKKAGRDDQTARLPAR